MNNKSADRFSAGKWSVSTICYGVAYRIGTVSSQDGNAKEDFV